MARLARLYVPDQPQHVILRGIDHQPAFVDDEDYALFIECLKTASRDHRLAVHAYVLMPSAVQLLATPREESSLPKAMQAVGRRYVAHFNRRYGRRGTLWEGRYRATVIEADRYFMLGSRLVELSPVRERLVSSVDAYPWSSYRHHVGLALDPLITDHPLYWALGNTPFERQHAYKELCEQALDENAVNELQQATLKGWVLGSESWRDWAARQANRRVSPLPRGRPRKTRADDEQGSAGVPSPGAEAEGDASAAARPSGDVPSSEAGHSGKAGPGNEPSAQSVQAGRATTGLDAAATGTSGDGASARASEEGPTNGDSETDHPTST
jgi:putative transposase